jgi:hypothetical protein
MRLSIFILLLLIPFSLANGLDISQTTIEINKTVGTDYFVNLSIKNTLPFNMYNISFNEVLKADKFNLIAGENRTVQFKVDTDTNVVSTLVLSGFYEANLGVSNKTEKVVIDFYSGFDRCNINLIQGDSITWVNNVLGEIKLKNAGTSEEIATIPEGQNYTLRFNYPSNINYYAMRTGLPFTSTCNLNVMGTSGLVRNNEYDDTIYTKVNISYEKTVAYALFPTTSYNLSYNEQYDDVFTLRNTGQKVAKNVRISATWISFDRNNFDLQPGESINVPYTVSPAIYDANQTNREYLSNIKVEGNFDTINQTIKIFVKYANIGSLSNLSNINEDVIRYLLNAYCEDHPTFNLCKSSSSSSTNNTRIVSIEVTEEVYKAQIQEDALFKDQVRNYIKQDNEIKVNQSGAMASIDSNFKNITYQVGELSNSVDESNGVVLFSVVFLLFIVCLAILVVTLYKQRSKLKLIKSIGLKSGEKPI